MKKIKLTLFFAVFFFSYLVPSYSQCKIEHKILADETMMHYLEPKIFYKAEEKYVKISLMTDDEYFFIAVETISFSESKVKIKQDLTLNLANKKQYKLKHYDTQYLDENTVLNVLYMIDKNDLEDFRSDDGLITSINIEGNEFVANDDLNKKIILEQLQCYFNSKNVKTKSN